MKKRKYFYIVECSNGINRLSTYVKAQNQWEAEKLVEGKFFGKYKEYPTNVESRKSTKIECENLFL